jgi:molecular chaperone GrpE (heat shock protein)
MGFADPPGPVAPVAPSEPSETTTRLIALRDKVEEAAEQQADAAGLTRVARELGEILALDHVVAFQDEGVFNSARQRVVDTVVASDPDENYRVATSVRPGYLQAGHLLRREDVILYRSSERRTGGRE